MRDQNLYFRAPKLSPVDQQWARLIKLPYEGVKTDWFFNWSPERVLGADVLKIVLRFMDPQAVFQNITVSKSWMRAVNEVGLTHCITCHNWS